MRGWTGPGSLYWARRRLKWKAAAIAWWTYSENTQRQSFFVLVDENLDFPEADSEQVVLSGSIVLKEILHNLPPKDEARVLVLVRSANDSAKDVERYVQRTHGFFPKAPMQEERIREILEPLWNKRFPVNTNACSLRRVGSETSIDLQAEFVGSLKRVDGIINESSANESRSDESLANESWPAIWGVLHQLRGDLIILEPCSNLSAVTSWIESMRGSTMPLDFPGKWPSLRKMIEHEVANI